MNQHDPLDLDSTEVVFSRLSNFELRRIYFLFWMMSHPQLVNMGKFVIRRALRHRLPIEWAIESTVFRQFCGGTSLERTAPVIESLWESKIASILDLSVEGAEAEEALEHTAREIVRGIEFAGRTPSKVPMFAVKLTGLFDTDLLDHTKRSSPFSEIARQKFESGLRRIEMIAEAAAANNTSISIDAEQSWLQDTIDDICLDLMRRYNRARAVVGTTFQFYRDDRLSYMEHLLKVAKQEGFILSFKAVRGAYLETERERASLFGCKDLIYPDRESTDKAFNRGVEAALENIDNVVFWIATHNQFSCEYAVSMMREKCLSPSDHRVGFAQLKGMSDNISFNLAHAGYRVAKYLPYGPVRDVLPYLFRRADENRAIATGQPTRELEFLRREMRRRSRI